MLSNEYYRTYIVNLLLILCIGSDGGRYVEKQRYDGWYNNIAHPEWGSVDSRLIRKGPSAYADGVYMMAGQDRASPRKLSDLFMKGDDGIASIKNKTALFAFFGQLVTAEIIMASESGCPIEFHRIEVEKCDFIFDKDCQGNKYIPFLRADYDRKTGHSPNSPREQINKVTSWIDGSFVYSSSEAWANTMRTFKNGTPLFNNAAPSVMRMLNPERLYLLGDPRTNQHPALLTFGIIFYRWHNVIAGRVQRENPFMSDEDIFQRTRRIVVGTIQNIIMYEYLPALLGEILPDYQGYKPDIHPGISHMFQSAAFRFGHTLIPPGIYRRDDKCNFLMTRTGKPAIRLCSTWWDSNEVVSNNTIEELIMGMASQLAEREDNLLSDDIRNNLFGPMEFSRRDLGALNIMRGRDNGLPDYNTARTYFNLPRKTTWNDINPELFAKRPDLLRELIEIHGNNLNNIDVYVGGMLESIDGPGELFSTVIKEQFIRLRDSDRFWFENQDSGELVYIYVCVFIAFIPILCAGAGYGVVKLQNRRRRRLKIVQESIKRRSGRTGCIAASLYGNGRIDKMIVREWLHANHKRLVKVKFGPEAALYIEDRKGDNLRTFDFNSVNVVAVEESQECESGNGKALVLLRIPRDYDLVLELDSLNDRGKFISKLEALLGIHKKHLTIVHTNRDIMLAKAETKERRQKKLEQFFREAYALTFGLRPGEKRRRRSQDTDDGEVVTVMRTSLSKSEFASALGMRPDAVFVKKMFNIVDKDKDGRISFQEFLDTVLLFSRGKTEDKLRIIFEMCDKDSDGVIDKEELSEMLRSLVEIARTTSLSDDHVTELIDGMFQGAGLESKESLNYNDFKLMMNEYKVDFVAIGLDCKGAKQNFLDTSTNVARMTSFHIEQLPSEASKCWIRKQWDGVSTFLEENRQNIFYLFIFYVITIALFVERFIHYSFMTEHTDLRHIMGVGIAITRGSAAALSFCYSLLLLTMSRNLLTKLKEFSIQQYIPLDSHIQFHKIAACTALFFSVLHTVGHVVNFYHVSTQPISHLRCLTSEMSFPSDARPTISFWLFQTITGVTGILLVVVMTIIFVFAHPTIRQKAYKFFWSTHSLYILLYALCLIHGLARLTGAPRFWIFFVGPAIIYSLDKMVSLRTKYMALDIIETELLPSDVIKIKFYRPPNLKYLSGQWVRLACSVFRSNEFHSFTLTSAPHENFLSCHIKAQGPWTWKLRNYFDPCNYNPEDQHPKIRIEGPFGGGNQDWYKFEVAVMVGGGIGVTPYASMLNDLVFGTSTNRYSGVACKKLISLKYMLYICIYDKYIKNACGAIYQNSLFNKAKFYLFIVHKSQQSHSDCTVYICENHFQRLSKKSIFTGLKAINHFGRPDMTSFLKFVQKKHSYVSKIGVFSCGPRPLTKSVMSACDQVNKGRKLPYFIHHFENFG
ncbi:GSCOCT00006904001.3-RA-CDS [Cotesia congregata]|uniref:NAD(P)H oxidase (H2O2-forming) n=1 Tax=Cotesia congregata TaxID=51543 RepID=A0A8J2H9W6_COTCN|nr:GSCOCT00006904001.3-RA-CDS [Cotesia congregata]CAG5089564.1 Dual oxidase isoform B [Cotesia congregata]